MKARILFIIIFLVLVTSYYAQKLNYNEILQETKNIQSAYINENSMLLRINSRKLKLINFNTKKEIELPDDYGTISQSKYDQYFITYSLGESNNKGVLIDKDGNRKEVQLSTYHTKISEDGKYIITLKKTVFGDGYFQIIDTETMENQNTPKRKYSSFGAEFIDSIKVILLYQSMSRQFNESARDSIEKEYSKRFRNKNISKTELKKLKRERLHKLRENEKRELTTKYLIYNISSEEIEYEADLIIDSKKYHYSEIRIKMALSDNKQKALLASYLAPNEYDYKYKRNNRLLEIDLLNHEIRDISNKIDHGVYDEIFEISFLNNNEFSIIVSNKGVAKYYYVQDKKVFSTEYKVTGKFREDGNLIIKKDGKIVIIDPVNRKFIWDYKNNNKIKVYNDYYPVHLIGDKIVKIKEAQK